MLLKGLFSIPSTGEQDNYSTVFPAKLEENLLDE